MTTKDVLISARAEIAHGWTQGQFRDSNGNVCLVGALMLGSKHNLAMELSCYRPLRLATGVELPKSMMQWNDAKGRTQVEVLAAFDKAIELAS
jgi:hypothetical protein